ERIHSAAIAALLLVFPTIDSTRLWSTASMTSLALAFYLLGALVAVHALRRPGAHPWRMHAGAVALYALSVLTYEATAGLVVFSFLLYCCVAPWRTALRRSAVDVGVLVVLLLVFTRRNSHDVQSLHTQLEHVKLMVEQGLTVFAQAVVPF